jgi:hypothetical protein
MSLFYQVFVHVYPGQFNRVLVHTHILPVTAPALPAPSLVSFGNFYTLRRYFPAREPAEQWASYLRATYAKGPVHNPIMDGGQYDLFSGVEKMCIVNILKVFKNSSLVTERGEIKISRVFPNGKTAKKARYVYYCSDNGIPVYARRTAAGKTKYAVIGN